MTSTARPFPSLTRVDAGGRSIAAVVQGGGDPLVVLEVGLGAESASWGRVAEGVARFARVCYYDRAGRGASDRAAVPRHPGDLVEDARRVVSSLCPSTPVILVGQSLGGLIARLYAYQHPREVAALVLVDSLHEDQFDVCAPLFPPPLEGEPPMLTGMRAFWSGGWRDPRNNPEGVDLLSCQRAGRAIKSLGSLPLRVLTASGFTLPGAPFGGAGPALQAAWNGLHAQLASLSSNASHDALPSSGHFVQTDQPDAVIASIRELVTTFAAKR